MADKSVAKTTAYTGPTTEPRVVPTPAVDPKPPVPQVPRPYGFDLALLTMREGGEKMTRSGWGEDKYLTVEKGRIFAYRDGNRLMWSPNQEDICALDWGLYSK